MRYLAFDYFMQIHYSQPVDKCYFTIKCIPTETVRQHLEKLQIILNPDTTRIQEQDAFGNDYIFGSIETAHSDFFFHITGEVAVNRTEREFLLNERGVGKYRYPYGLTRPGESLKRYFNSLEVAAQTTDYEKCVYLMHRLYQDFKYEQQVTDVNTTAEGAWTLGKGVCQDYAHIFLALCRMAGVPARYVAGMLIGEGASHAWAEVLCDGKWIGLDPTNDLIVEDSHVKLCSGRDAGDCLINRGIMIGGGGQSQSVRVSVMDV